MKILYWSPRILSILFIIFISLFALDVFNEGYTLWQSLLALLIHLLPSLVLAIVAFIAWKNDLIGGFLFVALAIIFTFAFNTYRAPLTFLTVSGPALLTGILFFLNYYLNKKKTS